MKNDEETEQSSVKIRLLIFLKNKNISQSKFEKICNLSNGYVNNIRKYHIGKKLYLYVKIMKIFYFLKN